MQILKVHINLIVPLGVECVDSACGGQTRPLRDLLLQLIDTSLTPNMMKVNSLYTILNTCTLYLYVYSSFCSYVVKFSKQDL